MVGEDESEVAQLHLTLCDPMVCNCQTPPLVGFSRHVYWWGLPFPCNALGVAWLFFSTTLRIRTLFHQCHRQQWQQLGHFVGS